jgi:hypothetical protein
MNSIIDKQWTDFRTRCVHPDMTEESERALRMTFYAGFTTMLDAAAGLLTLDPVESTLMLAALYAEVDEFTRAQRQRASSAENDHA